MSSAVDFVLAHREAPPPVGLLVLREEAPPMPPEDDRQIATDELTEALRVLDQARYVTRAQDNEKAWSDIGAITDYLRDVRDNRLPKLGSGPGPAPPPDPPPIQELLWYGALRHHDQQGDYAMDLYAWPNGGPRWIQCALAGRVEAAQLITPLEGGPVQVQMIEPTGNGPMRALDVQSYQAVGDVQYLAPTVRVCFETQGETMITAILRAEDGNSYGFTHSDGVQFGEHGRWENLALTSDSGIRGLCQGCGFDCRDQHTHFFGWVGHGPMPPGAGTHPARDLLAKLGWRLAETLPVCASPSQYQQCLIVAGRPR